MTSETYFFTWRSIKLEANYEPTGWEPMAHLEIKSIAPERAPLPITETGYKSHLFPIGAIEGAGQTVETAVRQWLDEEAQSKAWKDREIKSRQGCLFDF